MGKTRAAVVLFVDVDEDQVGDAVDLAYVVQQGLYQAGLRGPDKTLDVKVPGGRLIQVRIVDVEEAGVAAGNGYLWTQPTTKAWTEHGIYTEKQLKQLEQDHQ